MVKYCWSDTSPLVDGTGTEIPFGSVIWPKASPAARSCAAPNPSTASTFDERVTRGVLLREPASRNDLFETRLDRARIQSLFAVQRPRWIASHINASSSAAIANSTPIDVRKYGYRKSTNPTASCGSRLIRLPYTKSTNPTDE